VICEILTLNFTKMRLAAGLCPDPLGEFTVLPRPSSWILGVETGKGGEGRRGREGRRGKGREGGKRKGKLVTGLSLNV